MSTVKSTYSVIKVGAGVNEANEQIAGAAPLGEPLALGQSPAGAAAMSIYQPTSSQYGQLLDDFGNLVGTYLKGGALLVEKGGVASGTYNTGGLEYVSQGGVDNGSINWLGGVEVVDKGGVASSDLVEGLPAIIPYALPDPTKSAAAAYLTPRDAISGIIDDFSSISKTNVEGGEAVVESGATAAGSLITGGLLFVASGGTDIGSTVSKGLEVVDKGANASGDTLTGVLATGQPTGASLNPGQQPARAYLQALGNGGPNAGLLDDYGAISGTTIKGSMALIEKGARATGSIVSGGVEYVASGGTDSNATVSGGVEVVDKGGIASGDTITTAGGLHTSVQVGGSLQSVAGGVLDVYGATSAINLLGANAYIEAGGVANGYNVSNGGTLDVAAGGFVSNGASVTSNGVLKLETGANVSGALTLNGGTLELVVGSHFTGSSLTVNLASHSTDVFELLNVSSASVSLGAGHLDAQFGGGNVDFNLGSSAHSATYKTSTTSAGTIITVTNP